MNAFWRCHFGLIEVDLQQQLQVLLLPQLMIHTVNIPTPVHPATPMVVSVLVCLSALSRNLTIRLLPELFANVHSETSLLIEGLTLSTVGPGGVLGPFPPNGMLRFQSCSALRLIMCFFRRSVSSMSVVLSFFIPPKACHRLLLAVLYIVNYLNVSRSLILCWIVKKHFKMSDIKTARWRAASHPADVQTKWRRIPQITSTAPVSQSVPDVIFSLWLWENSAVTELLCADMMSNVLSSMHTGTESRLKQELFRLDLGHLWENHGQLLYHVCSSVLKAIMEKMNTPDLFKRDSLEPTSTVKFIIQPAFPIFVLGKRGSKV